MRRLLTVLSIGAIACTLAFAEGSGRPGAVGAAEKFRVTLPGLVADGASGATFDLGKNPAGVRYCGFLPGVSVPAQMPPDVINPPPAAPRLVPAPPAPTAVPTDVTQRQLSVFQQLWSAVNDNYVDPGFNGTDWAAIRAEYSGYIASGLTDDDFYRLMEAMVGELHDDHSHFQSPQEVEEEQRRLRDGENFVGVGVLAQNVGDTGHAAIIAVFPGSPAAQAGLRAHDLMLDADGKPALENSGTNNLRGPAGSSVSVRVQRLGDEPRVVRLTRQQVTGAIPVDYCLVAGARIGYILLPTLFDETIADRVRSALQQMTADGPLAGLVLDNRVNGGGLSSAARGVLGFFTSGTQGHLVSRRGREPFEVRREDVGGSQNVPLVVLVDRDTVSFAEVMAGILQRSGRATVAGRTSAGNVEVLAGYPFSDGSKAWIATFTFEPIGLPAGAWEGTGIVPTVTAPTRWDLFSELTDPALAGALGVLTGH